jgi:hypothetical protein
LANLCYDSDANRDAVVEAGGAQALRTLCAAQPGSVAAVQAQAALDLLARHPTRPSVSTAAEAAMERRGLAAQEEHAELMEGSGDYTPPPEPRTPPRASTMEQPDESPAPQQKMHSARSSLSSEQEHQHQQPSPGGAAAAETTPSVALYAEGGERERRAAAGSTPVETTDSATAMTPVQKPRTPEAAAATAEVEAVQASPGPVQRWLATATDVDALSQWSDVHPSEHGEGGEASEPAATDLRPLVEAAVRGLQHAVASGSGSSSREPSSSSFTGSHHPAVDWTRVERGAESLAHLSATYSSCHDLVRTADGIPALVGVLPLLARLSGGGEAAAAAATTAAAAALANLCNVNALNRDAVREAGGIQVRQLSN